MPTDQPSSDGDGWTTAIFAREAFDLEAIKRAAYRFSDRMAVAIEVGERAIECQLHPLAPAASSEHQTLLNEFRIEVLDQDLRIRIAKETESIRNLVLSLAFSRTGLHE
jgi:His-Xaa-Ser system protein HxsD